MLGVLPLPKECLGVPNGGTDSGLRAGEVKEFDLT